jgi:hypothetical protein
MAKKAHTGAIGAATAQTARPEPPRGRPPAKRAQEALRLLQQAAAHEGLAADAEHPHDAYIERSHAKHARAEAESLLEPVSPTGRLVRGVGEVATIDPGEDRKTKLLPYQIYDTLEHPNAVSVEASQHRLQAALGAGVLEAAVDATLSVRMENSRRCSGIRWPLCIITGCGCSSRRLTQPCHRSNRSVS